MNSSKLNNKHKLLRLSAIQGKKKIDLPDNPGNLEQYMY